MTEIYCVKLKQLRLKGAEGRTFEYFPFDRFYLVPKAQKKLAYLLFRYSLVLQVNDIVRDSLKEIHFESRRRIQIKRNNSELRGETVNGTVPEIEALREGEWFLVVPTYLARDKEIDQVSRKPITRKVRLAYTLSSAVSAIHNLHVPMPTVTLHTPKENIPVICAICARVADYHANKCTPGQALCRREIQLNRLPVTDDFRETIEASVKGGGEIQ